MAESVLQLTSLCGEELTSVRFGEGFIEFECGDQVLRALAGVEFRARGFQVGSSESGSRDAFCSLIGDTVVDVDLTSGRSSTSSSYPGLDSAFPFRRHIEKGGKRCSS